MMSTFLKIILKINLLDLMDYEKNSKFLIPILILILRSIFVIIVPVHNLLILKHPQVNWNSIYLIN